MSSVGAESSPFKPPAAFIKASEERQKKVKAKKDENVPKIPSSSPVKGTVSPTKRDDQSMKSPKASTPAPVKAIKNASSVPSNKAAGSSKSPKPAGSNSSSPMSSTAKEIEHIRQARDDRRAKLAQYKKLQGDMTSKEQMLVGYKYLIKKFQKQHMLSEDQAVTLKDDPASNIWSTASGSDIRVCVRKRPASEKEEQTLLDVVTTGHPLTRKNELYLHVTGNSFDLTPSVDTHLFKFDRVFDEKSKNVDLYTESVEPLVNAFMKQPGSRPTFFAFGQTGSGKSHTVFGNDKEPGIVMLAGNRIFDKLESDISKGAVTLKISFFEIYSNKIIDLLNQGQILNLMENPSSNMVLPGLKNVTISSLAEFLKCVHLGQKFRRTTATDANSQSSRSHAIMQIYLSPAGAEVPLERTSIFSVIDLAGSEKASEANASAADRQARLESGEINKSLLALKECIRALGDKNAKHVPFRASKLTMVLRDCIGGEGQKNAVSEPDSAPCKWVLMMTTIRCTDDAVEHSLNTLRYAHRLRESTSVPPETLVERKALNKADFLDNLASKESDEQTKKEQHVQFKEKPKSATPGRDRTSISVPMPPVKFNKTDIPAPRLDSALNDVDVVEELRWIHQSSLERFHLLGRDKEEAWLHNDNMSTTKDIQDYVTFLKDIVVTKKAILKDLEDAIDKVSQEFDLE
ncbi:hypothetical protein MP638_003570 [Amoeboaphelidium occidentale]|nr:hypothetical protein MP638_003570 [Amoeboaphelidium occidentale]